MVLGLEARNWPLPHRTAPVMASRLRPRSRCHDVVFPSIVSSRRAWLVTWPVIGLAVLCALLYLPYLSSYPAVGDDEPELFEPAAQLASHGTLGSPMFADFTPSSAHHLYWYPPAYPVALAAWMRVAGESLGAARLFSGLAALAMVLLVFALARTFVDRRLAFALAALVAVSIWTFDRARFVRGDTLAIALVLGALFLYMRARGGPRRPRAALVGATALAAVAALAHPLGWVAAAAILVDGLVLTGTLRSWRRLGLVAAILGVAALAYGIYILQDLEGWRDQVSGHATRKGGGASYLAQFTQSKYHSLVILVAVAGVVGAAWVARRNGTVRVLVVAAATSFVLATSARESGYFIFFVPLGLVCAAVAIGSSDMPRRFRQIIVVALLLALPVELCLDVRAVRTRSGVTPGDVSAAARIAPHDSTLFVGPGGGAAYFALRGRYRTTAWVTLAPHSARNVAVAYSKDLIAVGRPVPYLADLDRQLEPRNPTFAVTAHGLTVAIYRSVGKSTAGVDPHAWGGRLRRPIDRSR